MAVLQLAPPTFSTRWKTWLWDISQVPNKTFKNLVLEESKQGWTWFFPDACPALFLGLLIYPYAVHFLTLISEVNFLLRNSPRAKVLLGWWWSCSRLNSRQLFPQTDIINLYFYGVGGVLVKCLKYCTLDQRHVFTLYSRSVLRVAPSRWSCKQHLTALFRLRNRRPSDVNTHLSLSSMLLVEEVSMPQLHWWAICTHTSHVLDQTLKIVASAGIWLSNK